MSEPAAALYTSFTELVDDVYVTVTFTTNYNDIARYRLKVPPVVEWDELFYETLDPPIPNTKIGAGGSKEPNPDDVTYKKALAAATQERKLRLLAFALDGGGMMTLPGKTLDDKAQALERAKSAHFNTLWDVLQKLVEGGRAVLDERGETFRALRELKARGDAELSSVAIRLAGTEPEVEDGPAGGGGEAAEAAAGLAGEAAD